MLDLIFLGPLLRHGRRPRGPLPYPLPHRFCWALRRDSHSAQTLSGDWLGHPYSQPCIRVLLAALLFHVWLPDVLFAPRRTLATATSTGGYSFRVIQYWNRVDFYSTKLLITSPDNATKVVVLDGDDNKSWSVPIAIDGGTRIARVTLSGGRTKDIQW
jgi:hypothetical protein